MVKKQEISKEERCVNPKVFQEYISAARLVIWLNFFEPSFLLHTFISCLFFLLELTVKTTWRKY